jgi:hypothetical protein
MNNSRKISNRHKHQEKGVKHLRDIPLGLWLGQSTGILANFSHGASIAPHQQVGLFLDDLAQNILILGAIGSGKTTRAVYPFLIQLLYPLHI